MFVLEYKKLAEKINLEDFITNPILDVKILVDTNINLLAKWMIKCARKAENEVFKKSNRNNINVFNSNSNISARLCNVYFAYKKIEYHKTRKLYRKKRRQKKFVKLDKLLDKSKDDFW